jgi:hypothetical protein
MHSADALCKALQQGISVDKALSALPPYELPYIARIPVEIYRAAQWLGWRFFTVPRLDRLAGNHLRIDEATNDLEELKHWARSRPRWALATGSLSGVFVLVVDGRDGQDSLIRECSGDWSWLDTLRTRNRNSQEFGSCRERSFDNLPIRIGGNLRRFCRCLLPYGHSGPSRIGQVWSRG